MLVKNIIDSKWEDIVNKWDNDFCLSNWYSNPCVIEVHGGKEFSFMYTRKFMTRNEMFYITIHPKDDDETKVIKFENRVMGAEWDFNMTLNIESTMIKLRKFMLDIMDYVAECKELISSNNIEKW